MRNDLLNDLQEEIKNELYWGNPKYDIGTTCVLRGVYQHTEIPSKPAICFSCYRDDLIRSFAGQQTRSLKILVYGYANNTNDIHALAKDVEYFFLNDYSKNKRTEVGSIEFIEAKENDTVPCYFDMELEIQYDYKITEL